MSTSTSFNPYESAGMPAFHLLPPLAMEPPQNFHSYPLSGFDAVIEKDGGLLIGASTTFETLFKNPLVREYTALYMALKTSTSPVCRRDKTLGRVLYQDREAQGLAAALMAFDATLFVLGPRGERVISLIDYLTLENTPLTPGETVRHFFVSGEARQSSVYQSVDYLRTGQPLCGVATWASRQNDVLEQVRIVLSGCTPVPIPLRRVSASLCGKECSTEQIEAATRKLGEERLMLYNPSITIGSHLFNLAKTLIKRAVLTL
ncbi:FAD binding domain-containing protein [Arundinibacter roseus]|uniref:Molybdopterin dehydrogenase FAD-binding domain-containing protein n=1 Tax=Arundinibacter roseus TaxID=2070510 RepID=A0A4R4K8U0_9BACT|nr:FAD binding domain-containing protein [Arundinibacter roseus]TDB64020.1 hypothetical protein EZE20_13830 [Arundinibacter roseus]